MTHAEAITALLFLRSDPSPPPGVRDRLRDHIAHCSDCWATLTALTGDAAHGQHMEALFGCGPVQDVLFALVDRTPAAWEREYPAAARHLHWCHACRSQLAELVSVERDLRPRPTWVDVVTATGERAREAVGRLIVHLGEAARGIRALPDGFVMGPAVALAQVRGEMASAATIPTSLAQSTVFELGESGVTAEIGIESADDARAGLSLRLTTTSEGPISIQLREVHSDDEVLIARHTLHNDAPVYIRGLWPASFIVVLHEPGDARRYRVRLDIGPGA